MILATRFTFIVEKIWKACTFTQKWLDHIDVISRNQRNWPSLNWTQNALEGWTNSCWKHQVLMFYPLGKNSENLRGVKIIIRETYGLWTKKWSEIHPSFLVDRFLGEENNAYYISDTLACGSCATSLFLPHFDVICELLLTRRTATWNLFVK